MQIFDKKWHPWWPGWNKQHHRSKNTFKNRPFGASLVFTTLEKGIPHKTLHVDETLNNFFASFFFHFTVHPTVSASGSRKSMSTSNTDSYIPQPHKVIQWKHCDYKQQTYYYKAEVYKVSRFSDVHIRKFCNHFN